MRLSFPAPAHIIHEQAIFASLNDALFVTPGTGSTKPRQLVSMLSPHGPAARCCGLDVFDPVCQQCAPVMNRRVLSRSHSA
jgi:hypothetical protein